MNKSTQLDWIDNQVDLSDTAEVSSVGPSASGPIDENEWRLDADSLINWARLPPVGTDVERPLRVRLWNMRSDWAPTSILAEFNALCQFFRTAFDGGVDCSRLEKLDLALFLKVRPLLQGQYAASTISKVLGAFRGWYIWSCDADFDGFDFDTAVALESITIGGGKKGEAVLSHDPKLGPLYSVEFDSLFLALREATANNTIAEKDLAAAWLFVAFGCNPRSIQLLNDEDLIKTEMADGTVKYELRIPRIKKRGVKVRTQFRTRPLRPEVGALLERVVEKNSGARAMANAAMPGRKFDSAMFWLDSPRESLVGTKFVNQAYRWTTANFANALRRTAIALKLSGRDGEPLNLTPRRLRYTFATRLVQDGASPVILADALDHTDLQHVMVYYNARSDIVVKLDHALALKLAPVSQAFLGVVVRSERDAIRGNEPASRVRFFNPQKPELSSIGSCGTFGFCGLAAPIACYTCSKFQAWLEAPHEAVLDALLADRDAHLFKGADPKMTQARDLTIIAVAAVIERCKSIREEEANG